MAARETTPSRSSSWAGRLTRNVLLWMLPAVAAWSLITPSYNRFLTTSAQNLVRLTERPQMTRLAPFETDYLLVSRADIPSRKGFVYSIRTTDTHFNLILLWALFLAVPGVDWKRRLANLGVASLIAVFFHIVSLFFYVKFAYATQLGRWSAQHYSALGRNFFGLTKHLLDLPFKFALPLLLWAFFYLGNLRRAKEGGPRARSPEGA